MKQLEERILKAIKQTKHPFQNQMIDSLPIIYNIIYPSVTAMATATRIQLQTEWESIKYYIAKNKNAILKQRRIFNNIMNEMKKISQHAKKLQQKY